MVVNGGVTFELLRIGGYQISDGDDTGAVKYYGFLQTNGTWYIMKNDTGSNSYRYAKGDSGYTTAWTDRAGLTYVYFNALGW